MSRGKEKEMKQEKKSENVKVNANFRINRSKFVEKSMSIQRRTLITVLSHLCTGTKMSTGVVIIIMGWATNEQWMDHEKESLEKQSKNHFFLLNLYLYLNHQKNILLNKFYFKKKKDKFYEKKKKKRMMAALPMPPFPLTSILPKTQFL